MDTWDQDIGDLEDSIYCKTFECKYCGATHEHDKGFSYDTGPKKFCDKDCMMKYYEKRRNEEKQKREQDAAARRALEQPLVPYRKCARCKYAYTSLGTPLCGYFEIAGQTRLAKNGGHLTAECQEYAPRSRRRRKRWENAK